MCLLEGEGRGSLHTLLRPLLRGRNDPSRLTGLRSRWITVIVKPRIRRLREVMFLAPHHTAHRWQSWDWVPGSWIPPRKRCSPGGLGWTEWGARKGVQGESIFEYLHPRPRTPPPRCLLRFYLKEIKPNESKRACTHTFTEALFGMADTANATPDNPHAGPRDRRTKD